MKLREMAPAQRRVWKALVSSYGQDKPASTLERVREYLKTYPKDGAAWLISGDVLCNLAQYEEAARALRQAVRFLPPKRLDMAYAQFGHLYTEKGNLRAAERWYRKALKVRPSSVQHLIFLGTVLAEQGRYADAKHYHRRAIKLGTSEADEAYYNLGLILRAVRRLSRCTEVL